MGFSYHDNVIKFDAGTNPSFLSVLSGNFTVSSLAISSGQDPSHKNNVGDVHVLDTSQSQPGLNFVAGRHKTDAIAAFWNQYVTPSQTTVNDKPDQLNFAFTGTLALQFNNPPKTAYLHNMILGQGSYKLDGGAGPVSDQTVSNWWVGGKDCVYENDNTAGCAATDSFGAPMSIDFWHAKHQNDDPSLSPNVIHIRSVEW